MFPSNVVSLHLSLNFYRGSCFRLERGMHLYGELVAAILVDCPKTIIQNSINNAKATGLLEFASEILLTLALTSRRLFLFI